MWVNKRGEEKEKDLGKKSLRVEEREERRQKEGR